MNILIAIILSLVFAFLGTMPFLFVNTRLHENVNHSSEEVRHEKMRAYKRFIYFFILGIAMLTIYHFLTD
ncbi:hypothetical protein ABLV91_03035 [Staphylococcus equorum]|uniref:hypothetical protein n=1 Tax=Staphylococcus equorum TaxID=246432 RepID=UPI0020CE36D5|nr:hypothetical protein [Staphylococcus equorum]MEB7670889.1 hypothetical protein [Staphylococcus equorum]MEB7715889.1 hypothetical protein [Staphylococcus equorum]MEB7747353.1 hypothetical protein [Staphylococcus equorum]MEB7758450.1 hypothetical protein [Staphylococcus equorum]MEB7760425.1 hypothetical protein [Staphylococcus equorum]